MNKFDPKLIPIFQFAGKIILENVRSALLQSAVRRILKGCSNLRQYTTSMLLVSQRFGIWSTTNIMHLMNEGICQILPFMAFGANR